jgi:hypothetical protein
MVFLVFVESLVAAVFMVVGEVVFTRLLPQYVTNCGSGPSDEY